MILDGRRSTVKTEEAFTVERDGIEDLGATEVILSPSRELPSAPDALILPEDTYLLLQAAIEELDPNPTPLDLWVALERAARVEKRPWGSVVITDGECQGVKYIARVIVYDFDHEPICRREVVLAGLEDALAELGKRGCETIGIFPLGTMRGGISQVEYFTALNQVAARPRGKFPRTLYLLGPDPAPSEDPHA